MIKVRQVKIDVLKDNEIDRYEALLKKMGSTGSDIIDYEISKQSIDARSKDEIYYVYEFIVWVGNEEKYLKNKDIIIYKKEEFKITKFGDIKLEHRPVIVGDGPAGLFCAYILIENGFKPVVVERGKVLSDRQKDVEEFWETGNLNLKANIQFGEGGAGTFSDGKLNTLIKDKEHLGKKVFETFVKHGAPKEILYSYKPHIGTDILSKVVSSMTDYIVDNGGAFMFESMLTDIIFENGKIKAVELNGSHKLNADIVILAIGHSARETFYKLHDIGLKMENKPFAVGVRVEHPQEMIDKAQYGKYASVLYKAPYKLTYTSSLGRGVYSFCMCPGGYVVNASSEEGRLAINGMSYHARDSKNANSAIVVTVDEKDYGTKLFDGIKYQRNLEEKAYNIGDGSIPTQTLIDYKNNTISNTKIEPIIKGSYKVANINEIFSDDINKSLKEAFNNFGKKINGFDNDDTIIHAVESRTSSPVKILRDEHLESNIKGIYPCGEGAGYAGGITSAAIDGIKVAREIIAKYRQ